MEAGLLLGGDPRRVTSCAATLPCVGKSDEKALALEEYYSRESRRFSVPIGLSLHFFNEKSLLLLTH
jgi:hypothetical protein